MNRLEVVDPRSSDNTDQRRVHAVPPTPMVPYESNSATSYQRRASASNDQVLDMPHSQNQRNVTSNQKLIQSLRDENIHLKKELEAMKKSLAKFQQIEFSYGRLEKEYEYLANERKKQENLEFNAILQLEKTIKKLTVEKEDLQSRLEKATQEPAMVANLMINEIQQRQELFACKERQKLEIEAQNQTLEEQRNHITMLEKALANSQERMAKREKKCDELSAIVAHADELRKQLSEAWEEQQRREQMIEAERAQWEMEKTQMRMQLNKDASLTGSLKRIPPPNSTEEMIRLRKAIQAKDEKIMQLERYVCDLKKTLSDETERRKSTLATITDTFEARIKRLEDEKLEKDMMINELRMEKDKYISLLGRSDTDDAMSKMEDIRHKIQERRRKGRLAVTGGLISGEHYRSSSGSMGQSSSLHNRTSSGPFDPDPSSAYSNMKTTNNNFLPDDSSFP
ncbi:unnamed protein product [Caenorhabditis bovis]|uniref:Angiomotin C-terminal domain-containing protein n=1 Tax=Caenorhabditis bovis TaxID=2654633 RepID=A0A8S1EP31_9PELO|nr:unnamed protein product [Caenorhabditis bovis]